MAHTDNQDAIDRITAYMTAVDASPGHDGEIIAGPPTHDAPYLSGSDLRAALSELKQLRKSAGAPYCARCGRWDYDGHTSEDDRWLCTSCHVKPAAEQ